MGTPQTFSQCAAGTTMSAMHEIRELRGLPTKASVLGPGVARGLGKLGLPWSEAVRSGARWSSSAALGVLGVLGHVTHGTAATIGHSTSRRSWPRAPRSGGGRERGRLCRSRRSCPCESVPYGWRVPENLERRWPQYGVAEAGSIGATGGY